MSASERFAFVVNFSILVGDLIEEDDDVWHFYMLLYDIIHLIAKSEII